MAARPVRSKPATASPTRTKTASLKPERPVVDSLGFWAMAALMITFAVMLATFHR
jgi:hypothetical protein